MKIIIIAGGNNSRWQNYMNVRKQFAVLDGERLIDRTLRLFRHATDEPITFITKDKCYVDGVENVDVEDLEYNVYGDISKIAVTMPFWSRKGKTLILLGDVYFTEAGADIIKGNNEYDWLQYGRLGKSNVKRRHPSNENFAFSFYPETHFLISKSIQESVELLEKGLIRHNKMAQLYRIMCGKTGADADYKKLPQEDLGHFVEINDLTDDIDYPADYDDFLKALGKVKIDAK